MLLGKLQYYGVTTFSIKFKTWQKKINVPCSISVSFAEKKSTCLALFSSDVPILKQGDYSVPYKYTLEQMYSKQNYENLQSILNDKCIPYVKCH